MANYILKIECKDQNGLLHKISQHISKNSMNIDKNEEFVDNSTEKARFYMRSEISGNMIKSVFMSELTDVLPSDAIITLTEGEKKIKEMEGKHVDVVLCGSNARDTHLKGDNDLDIFVLFPEKLSREEFEKEGLRIGKKVFRGKKWEKAFSEHPYIRGKIEEFDVEIVPSYKVPSAELLQSSVDRSPFHNQYLKKRLKQNSSHSTWPITAIRSER